MHKSWVDFVSLSLFINICSYLLVSGMRCSSMLYFDGQCWDLGVAFLNFQIFLELIFNQIENHLSSECCILAFV